MKLSDVSVRRPVFAAMMILAMVIFGALSYPKIGVDLYPDVDTPIVTVTVVYPGADPETMEDKVTDPIEEAVQTLGGIDKLQSKNMESVSQVIISFDLDVDGDAMLAEVRQKVDTIEGDLPSGIDPPTIQKFDVGAAPIVSVAVSGDLEPAELARIAEDEVKTQLEQVPGVGGVEMIGARDREVKMWVDPSELQKYGLTVDDIRTTLQSQSLDMPAGFSTQGSRELSVKVRGEARTIEDLKHLVVPTARGDLELGTIVRVEDGLEMARSNAALDGTSAIALVVRKQSGANTVAVADLVRDRIEELRPQLEPKGASLSIPTDNSVYIERSIDDLQVDLMLGAALTVLIIFVFLNDGAATFISALALPTSVAGTFLAMQVLGFTFNNMTMLALSLSVGILVDDAIVVIENIHRHLEMGKTGKQAALDATSEIGLAVLATTLSIMAVFVPVAVMEGLIGRFFFQFGITVSVAVGLSMFVSFTLTPLLSSRLLEPPHEEQRGLFARGIDHLVEGLASIYEFVLRAALRRPAVAILAAIITFVGAIGLMTKLKAEFMPPEDRGQFVVVVETPAGTSLEAMTGLVDTISEDVGENLPNLVSTFSTVGDAQGSQVNKARIEVVLTGSKERAFSQQEAMAWVRARYAGEEVADITVEELSAVGGGQSRAPVQFVIRGSNLEEITRGADALVAALKDIDGLADVTSTASEGKPEISLTVDRARAADLGVPVSAIAQTVRSLMAEDTIGELRGPEGTYDITLAMPDALRSNIDRLPNIKVRSASGKLVALSEVVRVEHGEAPSVISRLDRQREVTVMANLDGMALGDAQALVKAKAEEILPPTVDTRFIGMVEIMQDSFINMFIALILAVVLVYMILAAQFDSFTQPIVIMLSLPLSFIGAFGALYAFDMSLNIFSMIGIIMLMGLVTKNAILLVDFANAERVAGRSVLESLVAAGRIRLRPILMTTGATIFGMLPVAMALSEGGETRAPMAMAVIGGMFTSTLLTLVVVPVVYLVFDRTAAFFRRVTGRTVTQDD